MSSRLAQNILTGYLGKGIGMALGILLVPFLIGKLGKNSFGLIIMAESLIALFEILSTSIRSSIAHHTTFALSQDRKADFFAYLSTGRRILRAASVFVLIAGLSLSFFAPGWMRLTSPAAEEVRILLAIMTVSFVISLPNIVYWSVLYSHQRLDLISFGGTAFSILRALLLLAAFSVLPAAWISLPAYGVIYLAVTWAKNRLIYRWHLGVLGGERIPSGSGFHSAKARRMFSFSFFYTIGQFSYVVYENIMGMILFFFWGPAATAVYAVSLKIPAAFERLYEEPTWALTPVFTELYAKNAVEELRVLLYAYTKLACLTAVPVSLSIVFFSDSLIGLWVGKEFTQSAEILPLHALPLLLSIPFAACYGVMSGAGKVKLPGLTVGPSLGLMLAGGLLFAKVLNMGLYGMVLAEALVTAVYAGIFYPAYACRIGGLSFRRYWIQGYFLPFAWSAAVTLAGLAIFHVTALEKRPLAAVLFGLLFAAAYIGASFAVVLDRREKDYFLRLMSRLTGKGSRR